MRSSPGVATMVFPWCVQRCLLPGALMTLATLNGCWFRALHTHPSLNPTMTTKGVQPIYLKRGNVAKKEVLLTFDDGPHPKPITRILDVLRDSHEHAVFFLVGIRMIQSPAISPL